MINIYNKVLFYEYMLDDLQYITTDLYTDLFQQTVVQNFLIEKIFSFELALKVQIELHNGV